MIIIKLYIKAICCLEVTRFKAQFSLVTVARSDLYRNKSEMTVPTQITVNVVPILMDVILAWNGIVTLQISKCCC